MLQELNVMLCYVGLSVEPHSGAIAHKHTRSSSIIDYWSYDVDYQLPFLARHHHSSTSENVPGLGLVGCYKSRSISLGSNWLVTG